MKKTTKTTPSTVAKSAPKATVAPTPAPAPATPATKKKTAAAKPPATRSKPEAATPAPARKTPPRRTSAPAVVPTADPVSPAVASNGAPVSTTLIAIVDVGFGNALYVRGQGAGLSWDVGLPMECIADDRWSLTLSGAAEPVTFKLLVNDLTWSAGADYTIAAGETLELTPTFE